MHKDFADWYRVASIDPHQVPLDARWRGIEAYAEEIKKSSALDVVRLYFSKPTSGTDFNETFRAAFKDEDNAFAMRGNELEMEVLAGATVAHLIDAEDTNLADAAALAVVCADFQGMKRKPTLGEIIDIAKSYLHERSDNLRTQIRVPAIKPLKAKPADFSTPVKTAAETNAATGLAAIPPVLDLLSNLPDKLVGPINSALKTLSNQIRLQQEESNMLWWLFAESSRDLGSSIVALGHPAASLVVGKELGDLTLTLPGPLAAEPFLDKMLQPLARKGKHKDTTIREAVNAKALREWKRLHIKDESSSELEDFCTVHFALRQSAEVGDNNDWVTAFEKRSGVEASAAISPVALATQIYRERLLIRAMK